MKRPIRKVLILVLALAMVCGLAVSGSAVMIGNYADYHEYVVVGNFLILEERRAAASVDIEDGYGGLPISATGDIVLRYSYYEMNTGRTISASTQTSNIHPTGAATAFNLAGTDVYMLSATGIYDIRLTICGEYYRFRPNNLTLLREDYQ